MAVFTDLLEPGTVAILFSLIHKASELIYSLRLNVPETNIDLQLTYRENLIYWVRGFHINIASFLERSQQQHNTPLFLTRSAQLGPSLAG